MDAVKTLGRIDSLMLAEYILKNYGPMSHLKLQKLIYYCEAYHLAYFDQPLTDDEYEAWIHGPVVKRVYDVVKKQSLLYSDVEYKGDDTPDKAFDEKLISTQKELINDVLSNLSTWKDLELEASTHLEEPWIEARTGYSPAQKCNATINKQTMARFYKKELNGV